MDFRVHEDIEVILELLGMTIQEFAQELGVSTSTVSRWKKFMSMRSKRKFV